MTDQSDRLTDLAQTILQTPYAGRRRLVALAGAPASGKSTLADALADTLRAEGACVQVVPMDGFHLDNAILNARGLLARKGAPQTFDAAGFVQLVGRLRHETSVVYPLFDRARDIAIAGAAEVGAQCDTVIVEGNYVLFDQPLWRSLAAIWDSSIRLDVPKDILEQRLVARWVAHGLDVQVALVLAQENDLPNAQMVLEHMLPATLTLDAMEL